MRLHFLRHATLVLELNHQVYLVDPMLSAAEAMDPVQNAGDQRRIPLVSLPVGEGELHALVDEVAGVLVTHTHRDHWDARAAEVVPRDKAIVCQPEDEARFRDAGFSAVSAIHQDLAWQGLQVTRTGGQHGTGEIGQKMGPVSGYVLRASGEPTVYIAGDTLWCPAVADALQMQQPDVVVVNAGAAAFLTGGPITMTAEDVAEVCRARPSASIVAVHMEAINHCRLTRAALRQHLDAAGLGRRVWVPADGEARVY